MDHAPRDEDGAVAQEAHDVMTRLALLIISAAGFGRTVSFTDDASPPLLLVTRSLSALHLSQLFTLWPSASLLHAGRTLCRSRF